MKWLEAIRILIELLWAIKTSFDKISADIEMNKLVDALKRHKSTVIEDMLMRKK